MKRLTILVMLLTCCIAVSCRQHEPAPTPAAGSGGISQAELSSALSERDSQIAALKSRIKQDGETMKVVVGGIQPSLPDLAKKAADLVDGQARSNDRTVQGFAEIPDPAPAGRAGSDFGYVAHLALSNRRTLDGSEDPA